MRVVIVPGTFDGVHVGHEELIDTAFDIHDNVLVLINSDRMIEDRKGIKLLMNETERLEKISKKYHFCNFSIVDSIEEIKERMCFFVKIGFAVLVLHGDDYDTKSLSALYGVDVKWWKENGIIPLFCHRSTGVSSTKLREAQGKHL